MTQSLICEIRGIGKSFGTVRALDGVDLNVRRGEIHALVGENGAGKTTLIRVLAGVIRPDSGTLLFAGRPIHLRGPQDAVAHGIAVIHQAPALFSWRSAAENCFNQAGLPGRLLIRWSQVRTQARQALAEFGADALWRRPAAALSTSQQQIVALAGARLADPELWILDEPTASLSVEDSSRLFAILDRQRSAGKGVIYVSHRLPEVLRHADRITVLRDGRIVRTAAARDFDSDSLVAAMVGRRLDAYYPERAHAAAGDPALRVTALTDAAGSFKDVHLQLGHGEILGIYGLVGAGRSELGQAIAGLRPSVGRVESAGTVTYLPEDRLREGNLTGLSARENLSISALTKLKKSLLVDGGDERRLVAEFWDQLGIRGPGAEAAIETFSGGNQQKVLLGRCLSTRPRVLILDEPTQGIDVAARAEIHRIVTELAAAGHAILLISSDLPEVLGMCHRVLVLRTGRVAAVLDAGSTSEEEVGAAALPVRSEFPEVPTGDTGAQRRTSAGRPRQRAGRTVPREVSLLLVMLVVLVGTGIRSPGFLTAGSLRDVATNSAALAVVTIGQTLVIAGGGIDISVGSMLALCAAAAAAVAAAQWGVAACLAVSVVLGAGLGSINAGISSLGRLHPIITTLGTLGIFRGVYLFWTGGDWIRLSPRMLALATTGPFGLAWTVWMAALYAAAVGLFLRWTRTGRACLKVGDNPLAARHFGLRVGRIRWCAFTVLGSAVGLGAILHTSRFGQVQNNTGVGFELQTIAAAVLGGAHVAGGRGTVLGAVLGAALIGLIAAARSVWEIDERWQLVIVGGLMLGAVALEALFQRNAWTVRPARARNAMR